MPFYLHVGWVVALVVAFALTPSIQIVVLFVSFPAPNFFQTQVSATISYGPKCAFDEWNSEKP